jgi:hypothetical protein
MNKPNRQSLILFAGLAALTGSIHAEQPPSTNTAVGMHALESNTTGSGDSAFGFAALFANTTGDYNTASGLEALDGNSTGSYNSAFGQAALYSNETGSNNTAFGAQALGQNEHGSNNTASGYQSLSFNALGDGNTASGVNALNKNYNGDQNTATGRDALHNNTSGSNNVAEGYLAGYNLTIGSNNIDIGNKGVAGESNTIRIGGTAQTLTFIAGISGNPISGSPVVITSTGQLGVTGSSERFKIAISPMGSNSVRLGKLRPVTFHLKSEPGGTLQYGLIAEEVAKVYPELVIRSESGRIDGVRYDELAPMLLNEAQRQQRINEAQAAETRDLKQQVAELKALNQATQVALRKLQAKDEFVAQR